MFIFDDAILISYFFIRIIPFRGHKIKINSQKLKLIAAFFREVVQNCLNGQMFFLVTGERAKCGSPSLGFLANFGLKVCTQRKVQA